MDAALYLRDGVGRDRFYRLDWTAHPERPHLLIAGPPMAGKTTLLSELARQLAHRPAGTVELRPLLSGDRRRWDRLTGSGVAVVTSVDGLPAELERLEGEWTRRRDLMRSAGATDIADLRTTALVSGRSDLALPPLISPLDLTDLLVHSSPGEIWDGLRFLLERGPEVGIHLALTHRTSTRISGSESLPRSVLGGAADLLLRLDLSIERPLSGTVAEYPERVLEPLDGERLPGLLWGPGEETA